MRLYSLFFVLVAGALSACERLHGQEYHEIAEGMVMGIRNKEVLLQDKKSVIAVSLEGVDKQTLAQIHRGDTVTLLSKTPLDEHAQSFSVTIDEIILHNGRHIVLAP